ncbi:antibiotic biosynthesis monooxygenase [Kitasatospora sp. NPDC096140]|uniref:antibiotic biosynthesis monooxygenase family protein n=1 Tax=Kitasatospora sp. NPDC096140 TaxID=3155425 RepID=UPI0033167B1E
MAVITPENGYYTLVNVFTVAPEDQERIYGEVLDATDVIQEFPGFVSANVHKSYDGTRVINYAQWHSKEEFDAMRCHPDVQDHFKACRAITDDITPIFCEVVHVHRSPSAEAERVA